MLVLGRRIDERFFFGKYPAFDDFIVEVMNIQKSRQLVTVKVTERGKQPFETTRRHGQAVHLNEDTSLTPTVFMSQVQVKFCIEAPQEIKCLREELIDEWKERYA